MSSHAAPIPDSASSSADSLPLTNSDSTTGTNFGQVDHACHSGTFVGRKDRARASGPAPAAEPLVAAKQMSSSASAASSSSSSPTPGDGASAPGQRITWCQLRAGGVFPTTKDLYQALENFHNKRANEVHRHYRVARTLTKSKGKNSRRPHRVSQNACQKGINKKTQERDENA